MSETRTIRLTKGKFAIVDADIYDRLMRQTWYAQGPSNQGTWYAACHYGPPRYGKGGMEGIFLLMHRVIMETPEGMDTDHRNHDGLDNRRANLRICTRSQNLANSRPRGGTSCFKGVHWHKIGRIWVAQIKYNGKCIRLGGFDDEQDAARAYNKAAIEQFGEFAHLNVI